MSATKYTSQQLTRWKQQIDAGPIISARMKLSRENSEYVGLCPFHQEKTPSFKVYKMDDGAWGYKCFGCGVNGNIFQFIQKFDKVSFAKAVQTVLDIAGVNEDGTVPENSMPEYEPEKKETTTFPFVKYAPTIDALERSPEGRAWLVKRGITMETALRFKIGFVQSVETISPSHLWRDGGWILFPTLSADEKTVTAVKYRSLVGKRETINNKSVSGILRAPNTATSLYSLQTVKPGEDVWVVEGEPDTLVVAQAGFIAVGLPSAEYKPTEDECAVLSSAKRIFLAGDNDASGNKTMKALYQRLRGATFVSWQNNRKDANDVLTNDCGNDPAKFKTLLEDLKSRAIAAGNKVGGKETHPIPDVCELVLTTGSNVKMKHLKWFWENRIPLGKLSLFAGNPDNGKSLVTCSMAALCTTGRDFPDATNTLPPSDVLLLLAEDDIEDTAAPRLSAAGADMQRIHFLEGVRSTTKEDEVNEVRLDTDIPRIEAALKNNKNIRLIIIDPVSSYLGDVKMVDEQGARASVLTPLKRLAAKYNIAVIMVMHLNKKDGLDAINRVGGAMAFVGISRSSWLFSRDVVSDDDAPVQPSNADATFSMTRMKNNLAPSTTGFSFKIRNASVEQDGERMSAPYVAWGGTVDKSADNALDRRGKHPGGRPKGSTDKMESAVYWLERALQKGPKSVKELTTKAHDDENISRTLLYDAAKKIGVVKSDGHWALPPMNAASDADREPSEVPIYVDGELLQ